MNIFVTSPCPIQSAKFLDDKRKVKMCLESTQMLCTALNAHGLQTPYKTAHLNHPCTIWTRQSRQNFNWLWTHAIALADEYQRIYEKEHACKKVLLSIKGLEDCLPNIGLTPFVNCARSKEKGIDYTHVEDIYSAYQLYLGARWEQDKREPFWS